MSLIVQKFGGTSVGNLERLQRVANKVAQTRAQGHDVVVVVSAMNGETDRLLNMAKVLQPYPDSREYAVLLSTGEQVSTALLTMTLLNLGCPARSFTGVQAGIHTDNHYEQAKILDIHCEGLRAELAAGRVPVVAGFQGIGAHGNVTTLGRGGSDTTAVALAAALKADECQIYTDVDGIYTADPKLVPKAKRLDRVTFNEMLELAGSGAKVLQHQAVEFAIQHHIPLRVLSSFHDGPGTLVTFDHVVNGNTAPNGHAPVTGIAALIEEMGRAKLSLVGVGLRSHPAIIDILTKTLDGAGIGIQLVSASELKVSIVINEKEIEHGACALHTAFGLDDSNIL